MNDEPKKEIKLKALLISKDGINWLCVRQFYVSDLSPPDFIIVRNDSNLWHEITEVKGYLKTKVTIDDLKEILKSAGNKMLKRDLVNELGVSKPTAYRLINQAEEEKHIKICRLSGKGAPEEVELITGIKKLFEK